MSGITLPNPQVSSSSGVRKSRAEGTRHAQTLVSLVAPVYNEIQVIGYFYERATNALTEFPNCDYEIVFVDDGRWDDSFGQLAA